MINYIGIDISKRDFHVCFDEQGDIVKFINTPEGIREFIKYLKDKKMIPENTIIGMESTGSYHLAVAFLCTQAGYITYVINPLITKKKNQSTIRNVKTDSADARLIRYCLIDGAGYPFCDTPGSLTIKTLVRHRNAFAMLRQRARLRQEEVNYRQEYLKTSISTVNGELYDFLDERIRNLDKILSKHNPETQKLLKSIPGVGPQTATTFLSEIGDISRFPDSKKLTAFIGLDSRVHQSGTSINGKGYITKRGNKLLRTRLFNATAVAVIHPPNIFHDFFEKKRSEGKPYRVALIATMHKMVHVIYAVWIRGTPFVNKKKV